MILHVDQAAASGAPGFEEFYGTRRQGAIRLAHLITGSPTVGHDVAQDAFVAMHGKWTTIEHPDAYLRSTVVNLSRSVQRRQIRERLRLRSLTESISSIPEVDETWEVVRRLPTGQRTVIVLRYYEDLPIAEIAAIIGRPIGTVKSTLHRAHSRLQEALRD